MHRFPLSLSFTDEDVVEFHVHGSPAVVNATLRSLSHIPYFRVAEPGEFTKRAFLNGKMSFLEVEALADLLNAETETQRQQAMHGLSGELSALCWKWRSQLMHSLAHAETILEFADDMDEESVLLADATRQLGSIRDSMQQLLRGFRRSQLVKEGIQRHSEAAITTTAAIRTRMASFLLFFMTSLSFCKFRCFLSKGKSSLHSST